MKKINKIIKDRDNKSKKLIEEVGAGDKIANDPGHYRKNFERAYDNLVEQTRNFKYVENNEEITVKSPFYGLKKHMLKWHNTYLKIHEQDFRVAKFISCITSVIIHTVLIQMMMVYFFESLDSNTSQLQINLLNLLMSKQKL